MRRIKLVVMVVAAMALMMVAAAAPAMAAVKFNDNDRHDFFFGDFGFFEPFNNNGVSQDIANDSESGDVNLSFDVSQTGNNSNQCVTPLQFGNTGNFQNAQGFTSFNSPVDNNESFDNGFFFPNDVFGTDVDFEGGTFEFTPTLNAPCNQSVEQSSAASSG